MTKGDQHKPVRTGPVAIYDTLKTVCGGYYTVYPAFQQWAGGELQGRSRAIVWSGIFDMTKSLQDKGQFPAGEEALYFKLNDSYWLHRLQMNRKTLRESLAWLESVGAIKVRKKSFDGGHPVRQVSLNTRMIEDLIEKTGSKGKHIQLIEYPRIEESSPKAPRKTKEKVVTLDSQVNDQPSSFEGVTLVDWSGNGNGSKGASLPPQKTNLTTSKDQGCTVKKLLEAKEANKEANKEAENGNSDAEESSSNTATRSASTAALLRNFEHNSFVSEDIKQEHSETKETREANASEEKRIYAPRLRPSEAWAVAQTKMQEFALSPDTSLPWYSIGYDKRTVGNAAQVGVAFAVRPSMIAKLQEAHPGTPFSRHNIRGADESDTQAKALAFVEAWDRICGNIEGIPDVWLPVVREMHKPKPDMGAKAIVAAIRNFPEPDDPTWTRNYHAVLASIKALDN